MGPLAQFGIMAVIAALVAVPAWFLHKQRSTPVEVLTEAELAMNAASLRAQKQVWTCVVMGRG